MAARTGGTHRGLRKDPTQSGAFRCALERNGWATITRATTRIVGVDVARDARLAEVAEPDRNAYWVYVFGRHQTTDGTI